MATMELSWCMLVITLLLTTASSEMIEVTSDNLLTLTKEKKSMFLYATEEDCDKCRLEYRHFVTAAQTFQHDSDIFFGKLMDKTLLQAFDVSRFPGVVFFEYGSATPRVYRGDITSTAIVKIVTQAVKSDFKSIDLRHAVELTKSNFDEIMNNEDQYRLVMLHEEDDEDEVAAFEEIAETFENELHVVIARIDVDKEKKLRYKYNAVVYPSFYWYPKGTVDKKRRYAGRLDVDQMVKFINAEAGLFRTKGGRLNPFAGLIGPLDEVLSKYGKELYELKDIPLIRTKLQKAIDKLPDNVDKDLVGYYVHLLDEVEEDKTIESLDESRNRLYRKMDDAGPLEFDQLIRKRNIVQKYIDVIGDQLLKEVVGIDYGMPVHTNLPSGDTTHNLEFHEEF